MTRSKQLDLQAVPTRHEWDSDVAVMWSYRMAHNRYNVIRVRVNFSTLNVSKYGLLKSIIFESPCPLHSIIAFHFRKNVISLCEKSSTAQKILSTPASEVHEAEIIYLAELTDSITDNSSPTDDLSRFRSAWYLFSHSDVEIFDGQKLSEIHYRSWKNKRPQRPKRLISDEPDTHFTDPRISQALSRLDYERPEDLGSFAQEHLEARLERIKHVCKETFLAYRHLRQTLSHISDEAEGIMATPVMAPLLGMTESTSISKYIRTHEIGEYHRLAYAMHLAKRDSWHKKLPQKFSCHLAQIQILRNADRGITKHSAIYLLLAEYYLPHHVLAAIFVYLDIITWWNGGTLTSLTEKTVRRTVHGFELAGIKGKSDQNQQKIVETHGSNDEDNWHELTDDIAVSMLDSLMQHRVNVTQHGKCESDSLFVAQLQWWREDEEENNLFSAPRLGVLITKFCADYDLPHFTPKQIRDQVIALRYVKSGQNAFATQNDLEHASITATLAYLNTTINACLGEANMKRFMKMLEDSVLFVTHRKKRPLTPNSQQQVALKLLFPISHFAEENNDCIIDDWIASSGSTPLIIGESETMECALQTKYYLSQIPSLIQNDRNRFMKHDLPRIAICAALRRLILASPLRSFLIEYEEVINDTSA